MGKGEAYPSSGVKQRPLLGQAPALLTHVNPVRKQLPLLNELAYNTAAFNFYRRSLSIHKKIVKLLKGWEGVGLSTTNLLKKY
jgi:hypothetical protein